MVPLPGSGFKDWGLGFEAQGSGSRVKVKGVAFRFRV
jgi:hypothetical protein